MFNGTCSKCAQLLEILRSASESQRKRSFRRKGSLGITSLPFDPSPTCICSHMLCVHYLAIPSFYWYIYGSTYTYLPSYIYLHLPTSTYIYLHLPTSTYIYLHLPTPAYIYLHIPTNLHLPTSTDIYLLPTSTYIYRHLPTSTYYLHLPTSTYIYLHLPTSTYIYLRLPTSTYICLHLPTSAYICLHLPTSTYIYLHLPTSTYIYLQPSQPRIRILGWRLALWTSNLHVYGIPGVSSERWNLFAWAALNGDAPLEVLVVTMDCPTKTCPSQLSVQIISAPACGSTNLSPSNLRSIAQLSIRSFCSFSICSIQKTILKSFFRMVFWIRPIGQRLLQGLRKKTAWCPENPKPGW